MKIRLLNLSVTLVLMVGALTSPALVRSAVFDGLNEPTNHPTSGLSERPDHSVAKGLSTPELIRAALDRGDIDKDTYLLYLFYAVSDFEKLPPQYLGTVPWHGTEYVLQLQNEAPTIQDRAIRAQVLGALSGSCGFEPGTEETSTDTTSTNFYIQYKTGDIGGGLTLADYRASLDAYAWNAPITSFGWAPPPVSTYPPPGNRYHVLITDLGSLYYGYVANWGTHAGLADSDGDSIVDGNNPNTAWTETSAYATCMVLNNDYSSFGDAQRGLDATTSHEFHHSLQFGLGANIGPSAPDDNFVEGSAAWMEDEVIDGSNDNYQYLWPEFDRCMGEYPSGEASGYAEYGYWLAFRGLTERYGTTAAGGAEQVMQNYWEYVSNPATKVNGTMLNALGTVLGMSPADTNLPDAFHAYAIAAKFMKTCGGDFVYPYCFEEAAGYVSYKGGIPDAHSAIASVGLSYTGAISDNYAINWITLPSSGAPYDVALENISAGGQLRASVVCDTGTQLEINPLPALVSAGESSTLAAFDPAGCNGVVAVLSNQLQTADNPTSCTARSYRLSTAEGSSSPTPTWNKQIFINDVLTDSTSITLDPNDTVRIVDRVSVTHTDAISFTLVETWTAPFQLELPVGLTEGSVVSDTNWLRWEATDVSSGTWHILTKSFTLQAGPWTTGAITESLYVEGADPQPDDITIQFSRTEVTPPANTAWEKTIWISDAGPYSPDDSPFTGLQMTDTVDIVDRVWVTPTGTISFSLVENWSEAFTLTQFAQTSGSLVQASGVATWTLEGGTASTWHTLTKTFEVISGTWTTSNITETLSVAGVDPLLDDIVLRFYHEGACVDVHGLDFAFAPVEPRLGDSVAFTGSVTAGTTPTYTWDFGDDSATRVGNPVTHTFPVTATAQSYTVTMTASNACPSSDSVAKDVIVRAFNTYLPMLTKQP